MPQVTVYVRAEDLDKWKAVDRKSEWLHQALNQTVVMPDRLHPKTLNPHDLANKTVTFGQLRKQHDVREVDEPIVEPTYD